MLREKSKGITLVALVITIVILLILAGISISTLTNTGIFQKAKDAKGASENAEVKQNKILDEYETALDQYDENTLVYKVNNEIVKIGDYVSYTPDKVNTDKILEELNKYSGTTENTTEKLTQELDLKWRVLDVKNGQVRLISAEPTKSTIKLFGAKGYNNSVYLIDKTCKTLYNNSKLASNVQNLKIEDIQEHLKYNYKQYENLNVDTGKYGGTKEFTENKNYPCIFAKERNAWVDGKEGKELGLSEQIKPIDETYASAETSIKMTQTCWYKSMDLNDFNDSIYYNLFINNEKNYPIYWMSSRCVDSAFHKDFSNYVSFNIYYVESGNVNAYGIYGSFLNSEGNSPSYVFRPVITLNSSIQLDKENSGDGTLNTPFNIK